MSTTSLQPAYVLHTRRFRESSLIVEVLNREHGRRAVLAKGALNSRSSRQQLLQPFVPLLLDWRGRGELPVLTTCEAATAPHALHGRALYCGMYVNELILRLCEREDPHSALFPSYVACINALATEGNENAALEPALRRFELSLLDELGMGLILVHDQSGTPIQADRRYDYLVDSGPVPVEGDGEGYAGATLLGLAHDRLNSPELRSEARQLMRRVLDSHLGGRPLRSRELFI